MIRFAGICVVVVFSSVLSGQTHPIPTKWTGTWELNIRDSTFAEILVPGVAADWKIVSQTLRIEQTGEEIRLSGETVVSDRNGSHSVHEESSLNLDGRTAAMGPVSLSFRGIDESGFEIVSAMRVRDREVREVSRFSFSSNSQTLTETKTQTEREGVPEGQDKTTGAMVRTSVFVLVFSKVPAE